VGFLLVLQKEVPCVIEGSSTSSLQPVKNYQMNINGMTIFDHRMVRPSTMKHSVSEVQLARLKE
jgi:hypothetical protein